MKTQALFSTLFLLVSILQRIAAANRIVTMVSFKKSCILSDYRIRARCILTITIMQESWKNELFIFTSFIDLHGNNGKNFLDKTRYYLVIKKFESQEIKSIICFYYPQYDHHHHYYYQCCCHHYDSYHARLNNSLLAQF